MLALAALAWPARADAQGFHEWQLFGVALASQPAVYAGGLGYGWRDAGRTRVQLALAGGVTDDDRAVGRGELAWHFLLDPRRRSGVGVYGGGGLAVSAIESGGGPDVFLQAVVGLETGPAARRGVFLEAGFGGGARFALGFRFRSQRAPPAAR